MSVYVDDGFVDGDWGFWTGGGHMQADTLEELHAMAEDLVSGAPGFNPSRAGRGTTTMT